MPFNKILFIKQLRPYPLKLFTLIRKKANFDTKSIKLVYTSIRLVQQASATVWAIAHDKRLKPSFGKPSYV